MVQPDYANRFILKDHWNQQRRFRTHQFGEGPDGFGQVLSRRVLNDVSLEYVEPVLEPADINRNGVEKRWWLTAAIVGAEFMSDAELAARRQGHYVTTVNPHHLAHLGDRGLQEMVEIYHRGARNPAEDRLARLIHLESAFDRKCLGV